jgi:hypothetical protein
MRLEGTMRRPLVQAVILIGLATPSVGTELQRSPASSLHEALWPLSKPGSVYPSAHIARQPKPEDAMGGGQNVPAGRSEAQQPIPAWSIRKEAIQVPSDPAAATVSPRPEGLDDVRARAEQEQEQALRRSERAGRRAVLSICEGCMRGSRSVARGTIPREEVGEDGLAYRPEDLQ